MELERSAQVQVERPLRARSLRTAEPARFTVRAAPHSLIGALVMALLESMAPGAVVDYTSELEGGLRPSEVLVENTGTGRAMVVFAATPKRERILEHLARGTHSMIGVEASREELTAAVQSLEDGPSFVASSVVRMLAHDGSSAPILHLLTPREREIVRLVCEGYRNKEIAAQLCLSTNTVRTHLQSIFTKLGVTSRARLVLQAAALGLTQEEGRSERF